MIALPVPIELQVWWLKGIPCERFKGCAWSSLHYLHLLANNLNTFVGPCGLCCPKYHCRSRNALPAMARQDPISLCQDMGCAPTRLDSTLFHVEHRDIMAASTWHEHYGEGDGGRWACGLMRPTHTKIPSFEPDLCLCRLQSVIGGASVLWFAQFWPDILSLFLCSSFIV